MMLAERGILITGGSQGLGKEIARACLAEGAHVLICGRSAETLDGAQKELASAAPGGLTIAAEIADVSKQEDVERLFATAASRLPSLDGVVNNAAVLGPQGLLEEVDWEQWRQAMEVNLFGSVLICRQAMRVFRKRGYGKIVNLSGGGATGPRPRYSAYGTAKAALVRLTETLAEEAKGTGIGINAVAPGPMNTRLLDAVLEAGPESAGAKEYQQAVKQKAEGGVPPEKAAALCVFLLAAASDGITGRLLSAVWDPWPQLPARLEELKKSDIYTLRRIVPGDRGLNWD
jgi:NAD(P)-dependent dehydrogenase (short-subunit alcohol dehydrogenase family)